MSSSTSRSFKVHVFTKNRLSLEQKNQEEDLPDALALLMIRSEVWEGKKTSGRSFSPSAPGALPPPPAFAFSSQTKAPSCDTTEKRSEMSFVRPSRSRLANIGSAVSVSSPETVRPYEENARASPARVVRSRSSSFEIPSRPSESAPSSVSESAPAPSEEPTEKSRACLGVVPSFDAVVDAFFSAFFASRDSRRSPLRTRISSANDSA